MSYLKPFGEGCLTHARGRRLPLLTAELRDLCMQEQAAVTGATQDAVASRWLKVWDALDLLETALETWPEDMDGSPES